MKVIYRGMNDIIKAIAKENGYSMNKARKEFANMARTGFLPYQIAFVRGNKNRIYFNDYIIPSSLEKIEIIHKKGADQIDI